MEKREQHWRVLKCWPQEFDAILNRNKTYEVRNGAERNFGTGDVLILREWAPEHYRHPESDLFYSPGYTGRVLIVTVTWITRDDEDKGLNLDECVVMGIVPWDKNLITKPVALLNQYCVTDDSPSIGRRNFS